MNISTTKFGISQPASRVEDVRLVTGRGRYTDDIAPSKALFLYVVRSQIAHANITAVDINEARVSLGVSF